MKVKKLKPVVIAGEIHEQDVFKVKGLNVIIHPPKDKEDKYCVQVLDWDDTGALHSDYFEDKYGVEYDSIDDAKKSIESFYKEAIAIKEEEIDANLDRIIYLKQTITRFKNSLNK